MNSINGFELIPVPSMCDRVQVRVPRSKRRRIRRKWSKRTKNWKEIPHSSIWRIGQRIYAHPVVIDRIKAELTPKTDVAKPARISQS